MSEGGVADAEILEKEDKDMYFLIDYENVNYAGLEGTEFLEKEDTVVFFFSNSSSKIVSYRIGDIEQSGCKLEICKLKNTGKNALDFYIATKVGEIFAVDHDARIAIVSADKDYQAVMDYWKPRLVGNQLVRCKTIAKAISCVNGESLRKSIVNEKMKLLDLQNEFAKHEERNRIAAQVTNLFSGTDYAEYVSQIIDIVIVSAGPKLLYLNSLKSFGRKTGTEVYRKIKTCDMNV